MTRDRRRVLEARIIADRKRNVEPAPFTRAGAFVQALDVLNTAYKRRVHRSADAQETWPSTRRRP